MKMLNYGKRQSESSIGVRLLQKAEKNIVIKSHLYKIEGLTADDIAQELRIKIWNVRNKYKPNKSSMSTFVNFVVSNCLKNLYRKRKESLEFVSEFEPEAAFSSKFKELL